MASAISFLLSSATHCSSGTPTRANTPGPRSSSGWSSGTGMTWKMDVAVQRVLGKLGHIGFGATNDFHQGARYEPDQWAKLVGLLGGHLRQGGNVPPKHDHGPSLERCAVGLDYIPTGGGEDRVPKWGNAPIAAFD
jgi:hypothetical protein